MVIKDLHIENFCGIENLTVSFKTGTNLIIGVNGAGKTSLLKAIGRWLANSFRTVNGVSCDNLREDDVYMTSEFSGDAVQQIKHHYPVTISGTLLLKDREYHPAIKKESDAAVVSYQSDGYSAAFETLVSDASGCFPLISYLPAERSYRDVKITQFNFASKPYNRLDGYVNCLSGSTSETLKIAETWCMQMELLSYQQKRPIAEYEKFKKGVLAFFRKIDAEQVLKDIRFSTDFGTMMLVREQDEVPLSYLSEGYKYSYGLILELMYRATVLNPQKEFSIADTEGVVILDEIDVHLHPLWQWRIIDALREVLPKVQFIFATHSPMVISSAKDAWIIRLDSPNEVSYEEDAYGDSTDEILSINQGSTDVPEELDKIFKDLQNHFDEDDLNGAEALLKTFVNKHGGDSPEAKKAIEYYDMNKWIGEGADDSD